MGFKCGLVGLPNIGKSTLFNALTNLNVEASNFPFCTINPNFGTIPVFDARLKELSKIIKPKLITSTFIEFVDIAGLVKGAYLGEGLGNKFLQNIKQVDAIAHVVRCFKENNILHINNKIDPISDIELVNTELVLSDLEECEAKILYFNKQLKKKDLDLNKKIKEVTILLQRCYEHLKKGIALRKIDFSINQKKVIAKFNFLTFKPIMYILNLGSDDVIEGKILKLINFIRLETDAVIPIKVLNEYNKTILNKNTKLNFLDGLKHCSNALHQIVLNGYKKLKLQTFFTVGVKEVKAWTINQGDSALEAAKKIHTDFQKGFIRANVISYDDFIYYKSVVNVKKAGKCRNEGKLYKVQDGDIINFLFHI